MGDINGWKLWVVHQALLCIINNMMIAFGESNASVRSDVR